MNVYRKPKILVINPNSSCSVTEGIKKELLEPSKILNADLSYTEISDAPEAIETTEDVIIAEKLTKNFVARLKADAYVIACFCDPGVRELRDEGYQTVFGIGESAMHFAANMGGKFGILSISELSVKRHEKQIARAGLTSMLSGDLPLDMGVLELENKKLARPRIEKMGKKLVDDYGAKSIILGCAGMGLHREWLQNITGVPVIDPCWAGVAMAAAATGLLKI
ncbi:MAG: aspartate/glutamate racemase family protein [Kordiimonadaceae bacterium]|nr:aspartate/glutamate racemase family protein [Kordiimonadaceae bacterium]